jgi:hypothetical protein
MYEKLYRTMQNNSVRCLELNCQYTYYKPLLLMSWQVHKKINPGRGQAGKKCRASKSQESSRIRAGWRSFDIPYEPRNYMSQSARLWKLWTIGILTLESLCQCEQSFLQRKGCRWWGGHYSRQYFCSRGAELQVCCCCWLGLDRICRG